MNLLEQHIVEIHSEKPYEKEWTKEFDKDFVIVDITIDCYGRKDRVSPVFPLEDWKKYKEQGYYMA